jgi:hypothetical protein
MQASAVVVGNLQYIVTICWTGGVQISFGGPQLNPELKSPSSTEAVI